MSTQAPNHPEPALAVCEECGLEHPDWITCEEEAMAQGKMFCVICEAWGTVPGRMRCQGCIDTEGEG